MAYRLLMLLWSVDASEAGIGDLDIDVICKDTRIPTQSQVLGRGHSRYTFVPLSPHNHIVNIKFNFDDVPGTVSRPPYSSLSTYMYSIEHLYSPLLADNQETNKQENK